MAPSQEPWSRGARLALVGLAAATAALLVAVHHGWYERTESAAWTLAEARRLATGTRLLERPVRSAPGLPQLFAPFAGGERLDIARVHLATSLAGLVAVVLSFVRERPRAGWPTTALGTLAVAASRGFLRACNQVSDAAPGLATFLGCLLVERWSARRRTPAASLASGAAIGLGCFVAPTNLVLLPAALLVRTVGREAPVARGAWLRTALCEHLPLVLGAALGALRYTAFSGPARPWPEAGGAALGLGELVALLGSGLASSAWTRGVGAWGVAIVVGLALAGRRSVGAAAGLLLAAYALASGARPELTVLLPVLAIGLPAFLEALRAAVAPVVGRTAATVIACAPALLWIGLRLDLDLGRGGLRGEHETLVDFALQVDVRLPANARVASGLGLHLALFLDRPVVRLAAEDPPYDWMDDRMDDPTADRAGESVDAAAFEAWIDREGVDVLALYPRVPGDLALVRYVLRRYGEREPERVETLPPGFLARVRP